MRIWILRDDGSNKCLIREPGEKWPDDINGEPSDKWKLFVSFGEFKSLLHCLDTVKDDLSSIGHRSALGVQTIKKFSPEPTTT